MNNKGRASRKEFFGLPWRLVRHPNFYRLAGNALKALVDLRQQYNGYNNGNLDFTWSRMEQRGWHSKATLYAAIHELIWYSLIVQTRKGKKYGGIHYPSLYGLTWEALDDCGKGYAGTHVPNNTWQEERTRWQRPKRKRSEKKKTQVRKLNRPSTKAVLDQVQKRNAA